MPLKLRQYASHQPSGMPSLGTFPSHWSVVPAVAVLREKQVKNLGLVEKTVLSLSYGRVIVKPEEKLRGLIPESFETYQIVEPGDIIIRPTDLQNDHVSIRVGLVQDPGIITSAYLCLQSRGKLSSDYAHLLLLTYDLKKVFYGLGSGLRQNLSWEDFKRLPIPLPDLAEQDQIVRFVRYLDTKVNRLIKAKHRFIELLNEQKQAITHQAVTRGLDPTVPLGPSGIDWVSSVPEHWKVVRLRTLARRFQTGPFGSQLHSHEYVEGGVPVINPKHMVAGRIRPERASAVSESKAKELARHRCLPGEVLFARRGELGRCALVTAEHTGVLCGTGSIKLNLRTCTVEGDYLIRVLEQPGTREWLSVRSVGSTMENLNTSILADVRIPLPPIEEQREILRALEQETSELSRAMDLARTEVGLIHEYRTRLVSDVVTGQLDIRHLDLPEVQVSLMEAIDSENEDEDEVLEELATQE